MNDTRPTERRSEGIKFALSQIAQLQPLKLTRLTPPEPPRYPYGRVEPVRLIGPVRR